MPRRWRACFCLLRTSSVTNSEVGSRLHWGFHRVQWSADRRVRARKHYADHGQKGHRNTISRFLLPSMDTFYDLATQDFFGKHCRPYPPDEKANEDMLTSVYRPASAPLRPPPPVPPSCVALDTNFGVPFFCARPPPAPSSGPAPLRAQSWSWARAGGDRVHRNPYLVQRKTGEGPV